MAVFEEARSVFCEVEMETGHDSVEAQLEDRVWARHGGQSFGCLFDVVIDGMIN